MVVPKACRMPFVSRLTDWQKLTVLGLAMPMVYWIGIVLPYPLALGLANPRGTWQRDGGSSLVGLALHISVYLLLTLLYVASMQLLVTIVTDGMRHRAVIIIWLSWALCSVILLFASPNGESHDIYDYVFRGRMLDSFAASPLRTTPNAYPNAPFYRYVAWTKNVDTYGPLWEYTSATLSTTVRNVLEMTHTLDEHVPSCPQTASSCLTLAAYLTGYRLLAILLTGFSGIILFTIVRTDQHSLAPAALATWLWNPLLLISSALGAHNDALMLLLVFLAFGLWQRQHWLLGWLAIGLAAQVKLTVLLFAPVLGLWLIRKVGWLQAIVISLVAGCISLAISWVLYAPLGGWATLPRMLAERQLFVANSLSQILYFLLYKWSAWPYTIVWQMMVTWGSWFFLAAAALLLLRNILFTTECTIPRHWTPQPSELYRTATLLIMLYLLVGSFWFQPWYFVWVLVPATLWANGRFPRRGLPWACFGALCSNAVLDYFIHLPIAAEPDAHFYRISVTVLVVMTIWLPLFIRQIAVRQSVADDCNT